MERKSLFLGLALGLTVAALVAVLLYTSLMERVGALENNNSILAGQLSSCQSSLGQCRNESLELGEKVGWLEREKTRLESELEEARKTSARLGEQLEKLEAQNRELNISLQACTSEKSLLATRLNATVSSLEQCTSARASLESRVAMLEKQVETLTSEKRLLENRVGSLLNEKTMLERRLESLQQNNTMLLNELREARKSYGEIVSRYEELKSRYEELVGAVVNASLWLGVYTSIEELYNFYDQILATSISQAPGIGWLPELQTARGSGERAFEVFKQIVLKLTYYPDNYVRYAVVGDDVKVTHNVYMLPNETVVNGGGDCDDLALLAYAMLKATQKPSEEVYLIGWHNATEGHVAVLLAEKTPYGKRYYIVDPAGNYLNGIGVYLLADMRDAEGREYNVYLTPLHISLSTKQWLFDNQLARIAYYHYHEKQWYYDTPPINYYTSADALLRDWIQYWGITLVKLEIHDIGVHKEFTNTTSLAQWLEAS